MAEQSPDRPERMASVTEHSFPTADGAAPLRYEARADWMILREQEKAVAEMSHVSYSLLDTEPGNRPLTFIFNGGPGAASAYLHMGALGPQRIAFPADGSLPPSPVRLVHNESSWLHFTDMVFVDPIGTGFSRALEDEPKEGADKGEGSGRASDERRKSFWNVKRDLESLGEFIRRFLTKHSRWSSPIFIAGESYGGFRVAKMLSQLQERDGVGLSGAILISPALEFNLLGGDDYDVLYWIDKVPTMAAAGFLHGRATRAAETVEGHITEAERFAREELPVALISGAAMAPERRQEIYRKLAGLLGLKEEVVARCGGRVDMTLFRRELLRDEGKILGLYDASVTARDPFPDRSGFAGPDPTLAGLGRLFVAGIYMQLREHLGVSEEIRDYELLSYDVFQNWKYSNEGSQQQGRVGATDDLRYGISLNPDTKLLITHGKYDLVTPYFSSNRLVDLMQLSDEVRGRLQLRHFEGGHMFYTWKKSREAFFETAQRFYEGIVGRSR